MPKSIQKGAPQFGAAFEDCGEKPLGIFNLQSSNGHYLKNFNFISKFLILKPKSIKKGAPQLAVLVDARVKFFKRKLKIFNEN